MFISNLIELSPAQAIQAINSQASRLINPPQTVSDILETLENLGLVQLVHAFRTLF
jgi:hypothetical protein